MTSDPIVPPELPPPPPPDPRIPGTAPIPPTPPTPDEKQWGMFAHLFSLLGFLVGGMGFLGPLIVWLMKKDQSAFVDHHGKESLNFQITMFVVALGSALAGICFCPFWIVTALVGVFDVVFTIIAGIKANEGVLYRYPVSIRFIH